MSDIRELYDLSNKRIEEITDLLLEMYRVATSNTKLDISL